jgi:hypothetical protein
VSLELFDDPALDRALASGLSDLAPEVEAVDLTLAELRPRFHRARTRRRVVRASAGVAALLVVGSFAIAGAPSVRRAHVTVESPARRTEPKTVPKHTSTTARPRPAPTTTPTTLPAPTNAPSASHTATAPRVVILPIAPPSTAAPTVPPRTNPPTSAVPSPAVGTQRYSSWAGSILVRLDHDRMVLVKVLPDAGFRGRVNAQRPSYIDVSFTRNGHTASRVVLTLNGHHIVQDDGASSASGSSRASSESGRHPRHGNGATELAVSRTSTSGPGAPAGDASDHPDDPDNTNAHPPVHATNV